MNMYFKPFYRRLHIHVHEWSLYMHVVSTENALTRMSVCKRAKGTYEEIGIIEIQSSLLANRQVAFGHIL